MFTHERQRLLLASIAANAVLSENNFSSTPGEYSVSRIEQFLPYESRDDLKSDLDSLASSGLLRRRNTGHNGYGNSYISGEDVWRVTPEGLISLWGSIAV